MKGVLLLVGLLAGAVGLVSSVATAAPGLRTAVVASQANPLEFARIRAAGATAVRLEALWSAIAPTRPASLRDPSDLAYRFSELDREIRLAAAYGLTPILDVREAPTWARVKLRSSNGAELDSSFPNLADLAEFSRALAVRYSGSFRDLPRVRYWRMWNEPNFAAYLAPQRLDGRPISPRRYRDMVNTFSASLHAVHRDNAVVAGGLSPFTFERSIGPLLFMREMLCMSKGPRPQPTCRARVDFDVWSHHPYTSGGPTHRANNPNDASLGDLPEMRGLLMAAYRAGHIVSPGPPGFWVTEFSWDSKPPDPYAVPAVLEARWVAEALHNMWRWGVGLVTWFLIRDVENSVLQSGLYFNGGPDPKNPDWPKPALTAFRFPFVAYRQGPSVAVWGRTPTNAPGRVTIEVRSLYGWRRVAFVRANVGGIFSARLSGARIAERLNEPVLPLVYPRVVLADTPRSYWRLEEKRGTVAHDQMGVTNGTYEGGVSGLKLGIPGALIGARDKAVRFLGGGRVSLGPVSVPSTVEFWAKTKSRNDQPAVSFRDSFHHSLILNLHGELPRAFDYGASLPGYTRVNGGAWHQIVYTFKAGRARLYVDGRLEHVQPWPREEDVNDSFLGYDASTRSNLDGSLDEVAIYDHALTGGQVAYHYVASGRRPLDFRFLRARMRGTRDASWPFSLVRRPDFFVNPFGGI